MNLLDIAKSYRYPTYVGRKNIFYHKVLKYAGELGLEPIDKQICIYSAYDPKTDIYADIYLWDFTEISKKAERSIKKLLRDKIKHKVMENDNGTARHVSTTSKTNN